MISYQDTRSTWLQFPSFTLDEVMSVRTEGCFPTFCYLAPIFTVFCRTPVGLLREKRQEHLSYCTLSNYTIMYLHDSARELRVPTLLCWYWYSSSFHQ